MNKPEMITLKFFKKYDMNLLKEYLDKDFQIIGCTHIPYIGEECGEIYFCEKSCYVSTIITLLRNIKNDE